MLIIHGHKFRSPLQYGLPNNRCCLQRGRGKRKGLVKSPHVNAQTLSKPDKLSNDLIQCALIVRNTRYTVSCTEEDE